MRENSYVCDCEGNCFVMKLKYVSPSVSIEFLLTLEKINKRE